MGEAEKRRRVDRHRLYGTVNIDDSKKIRVYLDTSVVSYLDQQDAPEKMAETKEVW